MKVVHVEWIDPCFAESGWMSQQDFEDWLKRDLTSSHSVGVLAYESESFIVLLQSIGDEQVADGIKIARSAIIEINELAILDISLELNL